MIFALSPGELFQHSHVTYSLTTLVEGSADLVVDGVRIPLVLGEPVTIEPNTKHAVINVGDIVVQVECGHILPSTMTA